MRQNGFTHKAKRKALIARAVKRTKGHAAAERHKATGVIPPGTTENALLASTRKQNGASSKTTPKATGFPHPPFTIKSPLASVQGLDPSVVRAAGDFIIQATSFTTDITPYELLAEQTDPNVISNILTQIMQTTKSQDERDYVLAALGRIRGAASGLPDPGPLPDSQPALLAEIADALGVKPG